MREEMTPTQFDIRVPKEKFVAEYRGQIIHIMVQNECYIDDILAKHYCGQNFERRKEFIHTILSKSFDLMRKKELLIIMLENKYPKFLEKHKATKKEIGFKKFFTNLIELRNICAHRRYITDDSTMYDKFKFSLDNYTTAENKIKIVKHERDEETIINDIKDCYKLRLYLQEIEKLVECNTDNDSISNNSVCADPTCCGRIHPYSQTIAKSMALRYRLRRAANRGYMKAVRQK